MTSMAAAEFKLVPPPPDGVYRVARGPDPFLWRDPRPLEREDDDSDRVLLAGNRFDAPDGEFRTLYVAAQPYGCMLEKLAAFRARDETFEQRVAEATAETEPDEEFDVPILRGAVPTDLFESPDPSDGTASGLVLGRAEIGQEALLVDLEHPQTIAALNQLVSPEFLEAFAIDRIDRGTVTSRDRRVTRALALAVWTIAHVGVGVGGLPAGPQAVGIRYDSVHGQGIKCFALWEPVVPFMSNHGVSPIDFTTPAVREAAATLHLTLPPLAVGEIDPQSW